MSDIEKYTQRAEDDLVKARDLVAKTSDRLRRYCTQSEFEQVARERTEAGLLIQSAAVWARLAGIVQGNGGGAN